MDKFMGGKLITLFSLTYAYKAKAILDRNNIICKIAPTPKNVSKNGCGYGIYVEDDISRALFLLKQNGIQIKNMY